MSGGKASVGRGCRGFARPSLAVLTVAVAFGVLSAVQAYPACKCCGIGALFLRKMVKFDEIRACSTTATPRGSEKLPRLLGRPFQMHACPASVRADAPSVALCDADSP